MPFPGQTIYGASKASLKLLTEGLYAELQATTVSVSIVHPGAMQTKIMSNSGLKTSEDMSASSQNLRALSAAEGQKTCFKNFTGQSGADGFSIWNLGFYNN